MADKFKATVCVIGGGPAGLMASDHLLKAGFDVHLYEGMPSLGRKFLMAGKSGLNITHDEPLHKFIKRYPETHSGFSKIIKAFGPEEICNWIHSLGIETFVGSSGRVFPTQSKAAPLLRAWIRDMKHRGLNVHVRHKWQGWDTEGALVFENPQETFSMQPDGVVYALGGGSWARLGSNGQWVSTFEEAGQNVHPFRPRNCGFKVDWSPYMERHFGEPVKTVGLSCGIEKSKGDFILSHYGVEGSAVYALSRALDLSYQRDGYSILEVDLTPDKDAVSLIKRMQKSRGKKSLSTVLKSQMGLSKVKQALFYEGADEDQLDCPDYIVQRIKNLPIKLNGPQPLDEAISTAGGLGFENLDEQLMITSRPGHFVAGEMLDWEAPTGGYLLTACLATGRWAADGLIKHLS